MTTDRNHRGERTIGTMGQVQLDSDIKFYDVISPLEQIILETTRGEESFLLLRNVEAELWTLPGQYTPENACLVSPTSPPPLPFPYFLHILIFTQTVDGQIVFLKRNFLM